jgi:predicted N-acetyltransferase YhbS
MKMNFRHYGESDSKPIQSLFTSVFRESEGEAEGEIIGALSRHLLENTERNDLFVFVASRDDEINGAIFVTRMPSEKENEIFLLAPVAVKTEFQGQGIGQCLINFGIDQLKENGAKILVTYGDPQFYSKVGFTPVDGRIIQPPFPLSLPEGWLAQDLVGRKQITNSTGKCSSVPAFDNPKYW